jgi:predicted thioredoxin/glutaredoxin
VAVVRSQLSALELKTGNLVKKIAQVEEEVAQKVKERAAAK